MAINVFPVPSSAYTAGTTFGATAGRPASPTVGQTYYNGTTGVFEVWNGSTWAIINAAPGIVTGVNATDNGSGRTYASGGSAIVAFTPAIQGGTATSFTVTSSPGGYTASGSASPITVTGMPSNVSYTYGVVAANNLGSSASVSSNSLLATSRPDTPAAPTAVAGSSDATITFTAPNTGGSAITGFTVTSSPGSFTATGASSPLTVTGLTNGTAYTFTVTATNANGTSPASPASNSATPNGIGNVEYLVVGGGGSSSASGVGNGAGGGGAVKYGTNYTISNATFTVTVGAAGVPGTANVGGTGGQSQLFNITAAGGGYGARIANGGTGASGGGAYTNTATLYSGGTATDGFPGAGNATSGASYHCAAAGGGAGGSPSSQFNGGAGVSYSIDGTSRFYGAGGAGGQYTTSGTPASGGAGRAQNAPNANTGCGAGGSDGNSYVGSAGVVVLVYPTSQAAITTIPGTLTYTVDTTTRAGLRIYKFTAGTGTVTI